jgi:hypothetical protein
MHVTQLIFLIKQEGRKMKEGMCMLLALILSLPLVLPAGAMMSYDIKASTGGSAFELHRATLNLTFSDTGSVKGVGNFSRHNTVENSVGLEDLERTSCTKNSTLDYDDQILLLNREGPVIVTVGLVSTDITDPDEIPPGSAVDFKTGEINLEIDEYWPVLFAHLKKITYFGPGMNTRESYVNNGDTVITAIDSWKLNKQSLYQASTNRSHWDVNLTPTEAHVERASNKTSNFVMALQSTGALTHLDVIKRDESGDIASRITQDYSGEHAMNLKIKMGETFIKNPEDLSWLDCCTGGYLDINPIERRSLSAERIFNCSCSDNTIGKSDSQVSGY